MPELFSGYDLSDLLGNIGVLLILLMYLALQMEKIDATRPLYSLLNAAGAALILLSLYFKFNLSAFLIEICWLLISLYGLYKAYVLTESDR
jgi:hypothetical protein